MTRMKRRSKRKSVREINEQLWADESEKVKQ